MFDSVVSNEYEIALNIIKRMLQKALITKSEFDKIDTENKRTFVEVKVAN